MAIPTLQIPGYQMQGDVNFTPLAQLPQIYQQRQNETIRRDTLASLGQGGQVDPMRLIQSGDVGLAQMGLGIMNRQQEAQRQAAQDQLQRERYAVEDKFKAQQLGQTAAYQNRSLAIQEAAAKRKERSLVDDAADREKVAISLGMERGSPAFTTFVATGKTGRDEALTAGDRKVINEAEDDLPNIQGTREALKRASELNSQTFSGAGAGMRAKVGTNLPDWMVPDVIADKKTADATSEWQKIMGPEALQVMANTLKGATTDFELRKFIEMLADPTTKPEIRASIIKRMDTLAARKEELANRRINEIRGGTYYKKPAQAGGGQAAPQAGPITQEQYNALPPGSVFTAPDGSQRVKP